MLYRALVVLMLCSSVVACGQTRPAAGGGPDDEREREALRTQFTAFHEGLVAGNPAAIRTFLYVKDDPDGRVAEAQTRRILANLQFLRAIPQDWGIAHGENPFGEFYIFLFDDFMTFSGLEIEGDRATVDLEDFDPSVVKAVPSLIKVKGVWKVDLSPAPGSPSGAELAAAIRKYAEVVEQSAAAMKAPKLKTVEDVKRSLRAAPTFEPKHHTPDLILSLPARG